MAQRVAWLPRGLPRKPTFAGCWLTARLTARLTALLELQKTSVLGRYAAPRYAQKAMAQAMQVQVQRCAIRYLLSSTRARVLARKSGGVGQIKPMGTKPENRLSSACAKFFAHLEFLDSIKMGNPMAAPVSKVFPRFRVFCGAGFRVGIHVGIHEKRSPPTVGIQSRGGGTQGWYARLVRMETAL